QVLGDELFISERDVKRGVLDAMVVVAGDGEVDLDVGRNLDDRPVRLSEPHGRWPIRYGVDVEYDRAGVELSADGPEADLIRAGLLHDEVAGEAGRVVGADLHGSRVAVGEVEGGPAGGHVGAGMNRDLGSLDRLDGSTFNFRSARNLGVFGEVEVVGD